MKRLICALLLMSTRAVIADGTTPSTKPILKFAYSGQSTMMPLAEVTNGKLTGGITKEILDEMQKHFDKSEIVGIDRNYLALPPSRLIKMFTDGEIDLDWASTEMRPEQVYPKDKVIWSDPILKFCSTLVAHSDNGVKDGDDLIAKLGPAAILMVRGYHYGLQANKDLKFSEVPTYGSVFSMIADKRTKLGMLDTASVRYLREKEPAEFGKLVIGNYRECVDFRFPAPSKHAKLMTEINRVIGIVKTNFIDVKYSSLIN